MTNFLQPDSLGACLEALAEHTFSILAGGTDVFPAWAMESAWGKFQHRDVLDISGVSELRKINISDIEIEIGALVTWTDIVEENLPPELTALKEASLQVGGKQVQNRGTIVGNLCNASPAADGVPPLLALDASLVISSQGSKRQIDLKQFILGNRHTDLQFDEMVSGIVITRTGPRVHSAFEKLGSRKYLVISLAMVAAIIELNENGIIDRARIAIGACSEVAMRLSQLEKELEGKMFSSVIQQVVKPHHLESLKPINDVRASAEYRKRAALIMVQRVLGRVAKNTAGERTR